MKTLVLNIQYDGTGYSGWQIQNNAITLQETLEKAIFVVTGRKYGTIAAGRTDAGVHAKGQVVSVAIDEYFPIPDGRITNAINSKLPHDVRVNHSFVYNGKFHARFDAIARQYEYYVCTKYNVFNRNHISNIRFKIDFDRLFDSAVYFEKKADFTTFSKHNPDITNPVCDVSICSWEAISENTYKLTIKSDHFLYGMVRSVVGFMFDIARNKKDFRDIFTAFEKVDRKLNSPLAPPQGLYLHKVFYPDEFGV